MRSLYDLLRIHPDLDTLELHLIGDLSESDARETSAYVLGSEPCQQMAEALNEQIAAIRAALNLDLSNFAEAYVGAETELYSPVQLYVALSAWLQPA